MNTGLLISAMGLALTTSISAHSCEKWKSEIVAVSWHLGSYIATYADYSTKNDVVLHHQLARKSQEISAKLSVILAHVEATPSCPHESGKYDRRKELLLKTLRFAVPTVTASRFLAPAVKEALDRQSE